MEPRAFFDHVSGAARVVVVGASGHAAVCIDLLMAGGLEVAGAIGNPRAGGRLQVPLLGGEDELEGAAAGSGATSAFVAIGDNRARARVAAQARALGFTLVNAVSPDARLSPTVELGCNVAVMAGAVVNAYTRLGDGVIVNTGATVDHDGVIGDWVHVAPGCHLSGAVTLGEGVFLGVGSSVIPGCTVGAWTQVVAGGVVVGDLPAGVLAVGVPARVVRSFA